MRAVAFAVVVLVFSSSSMGASHPDPAALMKILDNAGMMCELATSIERYGTDHGALPPGQSLSDVITAIGGGKGMQAYFAADQWGTPYRFSIDAGRRSYRLVSAGSDRRFDETSWKVPKKTEGPDEDVVLVDGGFVRSAHEWAIEQVDKLGGRSLDVLEKALDTSKATRTLSYVRSLTSAIAAQMTDHSDVSLPGDLDALLRILSASPTYAALHREDGWGTPFRVTITRRGDGQHWRVSSAGSDRTFEPVGENHAVVATSDYRRDLVNEDGVYTTNWVIREEGLDALPRAVSRFQRAQKSLTAAMAERKAAPIPPVPQQR